MKIVAIFLSVPLGLACAGAMAQGTGEAMEKLRACSLLGQAERLDCLEKLSRDIGPTTPPRPPAPPAPRAAPVAGPAPAPATETTPATRAAPAADNWIVSETTSPVDYSPVAIATASYSGGPDGTPAQLSIQCRGGRTDLVIGGPALTGRAEDYVVSYGVNGGQPAIVAAAAPASGTGVAVKGDVVRLLASLPDRGEIVFRVTARQGAALEGRYALASLKVVLGRLAAPCKWPAATGVPRN